MTDKCDSPLMLIDQSGNDLMMQCAARFSDGPNAVTNFKGTNLRTWRRAQARDKRRAEGKERAKALQKRKAGSKRGSKS